MTFRLLVTCIKAMAYGTIAGLRFTGLLTRKLFRLYRHLQHKQSHTFGSARFATPQELAQSGAFDSSGLYVGKLNDRFIRFNREGYVLVFAKTRAGKGAGIVVPNLLSYPGSIICNDIKGENAAITARHRSTLGPVYKMDLEQPFISTRFNPLDMVRMDTPHAVDDAIQLATYMHLPDPKAENHWNDKSIGAVAALILYVLEQYGHDEARCTLTHVRELLCEGTDDFTESLAELAEYSSIAYVRETCADLVRMDGSNEFRSICSTMEKATALWSAGRPPAYLNQTSDFDLTTFQDRVQTLYLMVSEEKLPIYRPFLRVMKGVALTLTMRAAKVSIR